MKIIKQAAVPEKSEYLSDFTGKPIGEDAPQASLTLEFNYGSKFDGGSVSFDLSDDDALQVVRFLASKLGKAATKEAEHARSLAENNYNDNFQARDWDSVEHFGGLLRLFNEFIGAIPEPKTRKKPKGRKSKARAKGKRGGRIF